MDTCGKIQRRVSASEISVDFMLRSRAIRSSVRFGFCICSISWDSTSIKSTRDDDPGETLAVHRHRFTDVESEDETTSGDDDSHYDDDKKDSK